MKEGEIVLTLTKIAGKRMLIVFCDDDEKHGIVSDKIWRVCKDKVAVLHVTNCLPLVTENNPEPVYLTSMDDVESLVSALLLFDE